jgi:DNA transformation protein and related proteins
LLGFIVIRAAISPFIYKKDNNSMFNEKLYSYFMSLDNVVSRPVFGVLGFFYEEAMFALLSKGRFYIRGGDILDELFVDLNCSRFKHVKKNTEATVNYYDVTRLYQSNYGQLEQIILKARNISLIQKDQKKSSKNIRLRDLPNMSWRLERMIKKAGIDSVTAFFELGAVEIFIRVREIYGIDTDTNLLLRFAGAIESTHWALLSEQKRQSLLDECLIC